MTPEHHAKVKELFLAAAAIPHEQRASWLRRACPDDSLRGEVEVLLARHTDATIARASLSTDDVSRPQPLPAENATTLRRQAGSSPSGRSDEGEDRPAGTLVAGRYRIVAKLGRGGMGVVYRADDTVLGQSVAIKFLPHEVGASPAAIARFRNEARLARTVTHPNVCRVHDIAEADGEQFITMEFVAGEDLASLLRRIGRLPNEKAIEVSRQTCAGLAAAHAVGVLHRDLKPANILLDSNGNVRLSDFGLAALSKELADRERLAGTPAYMAPEQINGGELSAQTDVYALGLVMYELFAGRPAFSGSSIAEYLELQLKAQPEPLAAVAKEVPDEIDSVVNRCLRKAPSERPPSALHVAAALPGTDARWLAAAAERTPDPELLAAVAAPTSRVGSGRRLAALAACLLAATVALRILRPGPWDQPSSLPPGVLADRARHALEAVSVVSEPYQGWGFCTTTSAWRAIVRTFVADTAALKFAPVNPAAPAFFYREGLAPIVADSVESILWHSGLATPRDPPTDSPGSRFVLLDGQGRLLVLWVTPPVEATPIAEADPVNRWGSLLRLAGTPDSGTLEATSFDARPPLANCTAWLSPERADGAERAPMAIGCSASDHPLLFATAVPSVAESASVGLAGDELRRTAIVTTAFRTMFIVAIVVAVPMVYSASRSGKVDLRGAVRIGAIVAAAFFVSAVLRLGASASALDAVSALASQIIKAGGMATAVALFYLAVDNHARRHWPHLMVSWNHLSVRGLQDPAVPHHVLIGICLGTFWALLVALERATVQWAGWEARPPILDEQFAEKLVGPGSAAASLFSAIPQATLSGLLILVLLVALRSLLGKPLPAAVLCVILLAPAVLPRGAHPYSSWLFMGIGVLGVCVWASIRFGMLAAVAGLFVTSVLITTPMCINPQSWLFPGSALVLGTIVVIIVYGLWGDRSRMARMQPV